MTRNRRSAKSAGARFEQALADYLKVALGDDRIERRTSNGTKDRGDITGVRCTHGRLVIEAKNCSTIDLPGWTKEAHIEAGNDDAIAGVVVHKRRAVGLTDMGRQWVAMELDDLVAILTGQRPEG